MSKQSLKSLAKRVNRKGEKTRKKGIENRAKRAKRKEEIRNLQRVTGDTDFDAIIENSGQTEQRVLNSIIVMGWFRKGIEEYVDDKIELPGDDEWWTQHQQKLAKDLLGQYGPEAIQKAVEYLCMHWKTMSKMEGWNGIPTVNILWGWREQIIHSAERGKSWEKKSGQKKKGKKKLSANSDEWRDAPVVGIGWK
jgi:hypothetical protein